MLISAREVIKEFQGEITPEDSKGLGNKMYFP